MPYEDEMWAATPEALAAMAASSTVGTAPTAEAGGPG